MKGNQVAPAELEVRLHLLAISNIVSNRLFFASPCENLQGHLLGHPDVLDACVVGVPDEYSGEVPLAFVVLYPEAARKISSGSKETEAMKRSITKHVSDHKIKYKWLAGGVTFIDDIPKTPSGKILVSGSGLSALERLAMADVWIILGCSVGRSRLMRSKLNKQLMLSRPRQNSSEDRDHRISFRSFRLDLSRFLHFPQFL